MQKPDFIVSWVSAVTGNRQSSTYTTKKAAVNDAKALFLEGARYIETYKFSEGVGAVSFNWRIGGRL